MLLHPMHNPADKPHDHSACPVTKIENNGKPVNGPVERISRIDPTHYHQVKYKPEKQKTYDDIAFAVNSLLNRSEIHSSPSLINYFDPSPPASDSP